MVCLFASQRAMLSANELGPFVASPPGRSAEDTSLSSGLLRHRSAWLRPSVSSGLPGLLGRQGGGRDVDPLEGRKKNISRTNYSILCRTAQPSDWGKDLRSEICYVYLLTTYASDWTALVVRKKKTRGGQCWEAAECLPTVTAARLSPNPREHTHSSRCVITEARCQKMRFGPGFLKWWEKNVQGYLVSTTMSHSQKRATRQVQMVLQSALGFSFMSRIFSTVLDF